VSGLAVHHVLIAQVGTLACAIPVEHVVETMRPLPVEPLGQGAEYVRGVAVIRGEPTIVIDAAVLFGQDFKTSAGARSRFVVVRAAGKKAALVVDSVSEVRAIAQAELGALPPLARAASSDVIAAIAAVDSGLVVMLEAAKLVPGDGR
jgi:purine-binding chemotaxis protein CheW